MTLSIDMHKLRPSAVVLGGWRMESCLCQSVYTVESAFSLHFLTSLLMLSNVHSRSKRHYLWIIYLHVAQFNLLLSHHSQYLGGTLYGKDTGCTQNVKDNITLDDKPFWRGWFLSYITSVVYYIRRCYPQISIISLPLAEQWEVLIQQK